MPLEPDGSGWIQVFDARGNPQKFYPLDPNPDAICIEDIARALAGQRRFCGRSPMSVAEHCVRVSFRAEALLKAKCHAEGHHINDGPFDTNCEPYWEDVARWGLLHDASEAYIADVSMPLKRQAEMEPYRIAEAKVMEVIAEKFRLRRPHQEPDIVRRADKELLSIEAHRYMRPLHADWNLPPPPEDYAEPWGYLKDAAPWSRGLAEGLFLKRYAELWEPK
jgi:uncharacterized protein